MGSPADHAGFSEVELSALGDLDGAWVLNYPCASEQDAMVLASLGATVLAVGPNVTPPRDSGDTPDQAQMSITWHTGELADLPREEWEGQFDKAYVGPHSLAWIENLDDWAVDIADALVPGGALIVFDEHPLARVAVGGTEAAALEDATAGDWELKSLEEPVLLGDWTLEALEGAVSERGMEVLEVLELVGAQRFLSVVEVLDDWDLQELGPVPTAFLMVAMKRADEGEEST